MLSCVYVTIAFLCYFFIIYWYCIIIVASLNHCSTVVVGAFMLAVEPSVSLDQSLALSRLQCSLELGF